MQLRIGRAGPTYSAFAGASSPGDVQQVLDGSHTMNLARLGAEVLDQVGLLELASQVDDAVFDIDVDLPLGHVGVAEDLALDFAR